MSNTVVSKGGSDYGMKDKLISSDENDTFT